MSTSASFHVIDEATAVDIAATDDHDVACTILWNRGRTLDDDGDLFPWSGYCMLDLLSYLTKRGISLTDAGYDNVVTAIETTAAVLGLVHRPLLSRLDPAAFTSAELIESMAEFAFDAEEAVMAATDGLNSLRAGIDALGEGDLLIITVA
jgi:hypothetical protein